MASRTTALLLTAAMPVVVVGAMLPVTMSADYIVVGGDDYGWDLSVNYNEWASDQEFYVGDILVFDYEIDQPFPHNVVMVDQASFQACTVPNNAFTLTSGYDIVPLWYPGQYFYISSINADCKSGMKLAINVAQDG